MCVTWCHKRHLLYWNHDSCPASLCGFAGQVAGQCETCRHRRDDGRCALTTASLPATGCCHWNADLAGGPQPVVTGMLALLWPVTGETVAEVLDRLDAPYTVGDDGEVLIDPDDLGLPELYGVGTEEDAEPDIPILENPDFEW